MSTKKKIAFFLPYNASMWHSLEKAWKKLDTSEEWDAFVMPIPYYQKNPDGSFGVMHWEGDQFPTDVPIIDYRTINLGELHPDAIYIHNPYDEMNKITSVHPDYYARKLKDYTKQLVYIPYFTVLGEIVNLDKFKIYVIKPGVVFSHKVILQSEEVRKAYLDVLVKEYGKNAYSYFKDRLVVDDIKNIESNHSNGMIPRNWQSIIYKKDGTRKKVILYNIGIAPFIAYGQKMLDKIQAVLAVFKSNQDSVALLWRPHPLIEETLISQHPELLREYKNIVDAFKEENWGIYDDSADLKRAVDLSNAFFGDSSSVINLFTNTGKLCFIQDIDIFYD